MKAVVQAGVHQNFESLAGDMTYNCLYLARVLDNRVTVTRDPALKEKLFQANETLKRELQPVERACDAVRRDPSPSNLDQKEVHVKALSGALRDALDVISQGKRREVREWMSPVRHLIAECFFLKRSGCLV